MNDFVYHNPVKVIFGRHALAQTGKEAARYGKNALLVYGKNSLKSNGTLSLITDSLNESGVHTVEHQGVNPNPVLSFVHEGIDKVRTLDCSMVIGAGGGSVMDTAKAIASGVPVRHDIWKFFTGRKTVKESLPVITIPTSAGTGSEVNGGMVLTDDRKRLKLGFAHRRLVPCACISDPTLSFTVPYSQSAFGAVDTFVHCLESYLSATQPVPPLQMRQFEMIMKTVVETIGKVLLSPHSYNERSTLLWCGSVAMSGICTAGVGRVNFPLHILEHSISVSGDIAHGAGLSALLPGWLFANKSRIEDRLCRLGRSVFSKNVADAPFTASDTIRCIVDFLNQIRCPLCLEDIGIREHDFAQIIEHSLYQAKIWRFRDYDENQLRTLLQRCLSSNLAY